MSYAFIHGILLKPSSMRRIKSFSKLRGRLLTFVIFSLITWVFLYKAKNEDFKQNRSIFHNLITKKIDPINEYYSNKILINSSKTAICADTDDETRRFLLKLLTSEQRTKHHPSMYKTIIEPRTVCNPKTDATKQQANVIAYVFTRLTDDPKRRQLIRETWASHTMFPSLYAVFPLGSSLNQTVNRLVREESDRYGDILQGDFIETYFNLSFKSIMSWQWMHKRCNLSLIRAVLKVDDDVMVNTPLLLSNVSKSVKPGEFICHVGKGQTVEKDVPFLDFPWRRSVYNTYCSGVWFMFSPDLVEQLYRTAQMNMGFRYDDVYVGMLASCIDSVKFRNHDGLPAQNVNSGLKNVTSYPAVLDLKNRSDFLKVWDIFIRK
jgi:hypothetical protein